MEHTYQVPAAIKSEPFDNEIHRVLEQSYQKAAAMNAVKCEKEANSTDENSNPVPGAVKSETWEKKVNQTGGTYSRVIDRRHDSRVGRSKVQQAAMRRS